MDWITERRRNRSPWVVAAEQGQDDIDNLEISSRTPGLGKMIDSSPAIKLESLASKMIPAPVLRAGKMIPAPAK